MGSDVDLDPVEELESFARYCDSVKVDCVGPQWLTWHERAAWARRVAESIRTAIVHEQERQDADEAEWIERREIQGEWMAELQQKGYRLVYHRESEPCFSCALSKVIRELPTLAPAPAGPESEAPNPESGAHRE